MLVVTRSGSTVCIAAQRLVSLGSLVGKQIASEQSAYSMSQSIRIVSDQEPIFLLKKRELGLN
jgi:hypothetical protein